MFHYRSFLFSGWICFSAKTMRIWCNFVVFAHRRGSRNQTCDQSSLQYISRERCARKHAQQPSPKISGLLTNANIRVVNQENRKNHLFWGKPRRICSVFSIGLFLPWFGKETFERKFLLLFFALHSSFFSFFSFLDNSFLPFFSFSPWFFFCIYNFSNCTDRHDLQCRK